MTTSTRERRDWTLLIFIIPIGIILMLIAGQIAIQLVPIWSINAGMQSNLDPNNLPNQQSGPVQPILPAILTPLGWFDTFLTPGADTEDQIIFPPFIIIEPSATPVVTLPPPTAVTPPPVTPVTDTPIVTTSPPVTTTKKPPTSTPPTSTPPTSTPPTSTPPTSTPPTSTPPTSTPPTSTPPTSTPPTEVSITSTVPPSATAMTPAPADAVGTPDPQIYNLEDGTYIVLNLGSNPLQVTGSNPDYDLVYYEMEFSILGIPSGNIYLDQVMIGITNDPTGGTFYTVFYWGDGDPDKNTNVGDIAVSTRGEADNQQIALSDLYGTDPYQTGIAIDVDNAVSNPPVNSYQYVVIFAPIIGAVGESANINAVEVIPEPPIVAGAPAQAVDNVPAPPADNEPAPPADNEPAPPADNEPAPPADNEPAPPADNEPAPPADNEPAPP